MKKINKQIEFRYKLWNHQWIAQKRPIYVSATSRSKAITKAIHEENAVGFWDDMWSVVKIKPRIKNTKDEN